MGKKNQPTLTEVISAYKLPAAICLLLMAMKFGYVKIGEFDFLGFTIRLPDFSIVVYFLSGCLLLLSVKLRYFLPCPNGKHSMSIRFVFLVLSLFTLSASIPPNYPASISENLAMMGYFFISLFLAHIVIKRAFIANLFILTKERAAALQISRFTYFFRALVKMANYLVITTALIMFLFFIFDDEKINQHGLVAVSFSVLIGTIMQFYIERTSKDKKALLQKSVYKYALLMNKPERMKKYAKIFNDMDNNLLSNRERQNIISKHLSNEYEELINIPEYENSSRFVMEMDADKRQITLKLKTGESDFKVRRIFLAFRYSLAFHIIKEKIDGDTFTSEDLLSIFEHIVDKDIPTKKKLQSAINNARKHKNYAGIIVIPDFQIRGKPPSPIDKNHLAIGIYISLEYSLSLFKFNELCSQYFADNDEFNPAEQKQFSAMLKHVTQKHLNEIALQEKDRVSGYDLAMFAISTGSYNKLKTAIEIDSVDVNKKRKGTEWTLLNSTVARGYYELTKYLLDKGADPNIPNYLDSFPIHFASHYDNTPLVELLLEFGAKIEVKNSNGNTPLLIAITQNNEKTVEFLLKKGANIKAVNNAKISVMELARKIDPKLVRLITQSEQHTAR